MSEKYRATSFYNGVNTFKTAFPHLADALVEWRESHGPEHKFTGEARKTGFRRGNFTQGVLPCSNPSCHEGGYQVDRLIAEMCMLGETQREGMMLCAGREIAEESRRGPIRCLNRIEFTVTLTPRGDERPRDSGGDRRPFRRGRNRPPRRRPAA